MKPEETVTVWITRWALTQGIQMQRVTLTNDGTMATYRPSTSYFNVHIHGNDFHLTEEAAKARANDMLARKIASTEKTLARLKKLAF